VNEYWKQLLIPDTFEIALFVKKESFVASFNEALEMLIFQFDDKSKLNSKNIQKAASVLVQLKEKGETFDLTFPLNQVLVEMLLQILIDTKNVKISESWQDYLEIIQQFASDTLKISPSHLSVTLIS
jgi:hypothetical protein